MPNNPISLPSGYATAFAIGFADGANGDLSIVNGDRPLPVMPISPPPAAPLSGATSASMVAGPFSPALARPVYLTLSGVWQGTVTLQRSPDNGVSRYPLTAGGQAWGRYTANACEMVWEEQAAGATLFLAIALDSGTLNYSLAQ